MILENQMLFSTRQKQFPTKESFELIWMCTLIDFQQKSSTFFRIFENGPWNHSASLEDISIMKM